MNLFTWKSKQACKQGEMLIKTQILRDSTIALQI